MLKSMEELRDDISDILSETAEPLSATAISKEVGYTKLNAQVLSILNNMVDDGDVLKEQADNGYYTYTLLLEEDEDLPDDEIDYDSDNEDTDEPNDLMPQEIDETTIPINCHDYTIYSLAKDHVKVIFPEKDEDDNEKSIVLEPDERLLVINQNAAFRFVVTSPEDVLEAIHIYTTEMKITTYLVTDMSTGNSISDVDNLDMSGPSVLFLEISRHNKAGN